MKSIENMLKICQTFINHLGELSVNDHLKSHHLIAKQKCKKCALWKKIIQVWNDMKKENSIFIFRLIIH